MAGRKRTEADEIVVALGIERRTAKAARKGQPSCRDCFFHRHLLCALDVEGPCSTFRPDSPEGLLPPVQPALLPRRRFEETVPASAASAASVS